MKRLVGGWVPSLILILAVGCSLVSPATEELIQEKRNALASAKVQLSAAQTADAPDYERLKAAVQVAEAELDAAKAKAVQEKVSRGEQYVELGSSILGNVAQIFLPGSGIVATALFKVLAGLFLKKESPSAPAP